MYVFSIRDFYKIKLVIIFLFTSYTSYSQINNKPCLAERLCETKNLNNSYPGQSQNYPINSGCGNATFSRTVFYRLIIKSGNKFTFKIKPKSKADYDWAVWKNIDNCENILNIQPDRFSANDGIGSYPVYTPNWDTGLDISKPSSFVCQSGGSANDGILSAIDVNAGDEILLAIDLAQSYNGVSDYLLSFEGSTGGGGDATFLCIEEYDPFYICDVNNDNIETNFNLNKVKENIVKEYLKGDTSYDIKFYTNEKDLVKEVNAINYINIVANSTKIYCNIIKPNKDIYSSLSIDLNLVKYPVGKDIEITTCIDKADLHQYDYLLSATLDKTIFYYDNIAEAQKGGKPLTMPVTINGKQTFYALIKTNKGECSIIQKLTIQPLASPQVDPLLICSGENATLTVKNPASTVRWYEVPTGGSTIYTGALFPLGVQINQKSGPISKNYYVEQEDKGGCVSERVPVTVTVNPTPVINLGSEQTVCKGTPITLDAGNPGATYLWNNGATTQTINVTASGTYSVTVTNNYGCSVTSSVIINFLNPFIKEVKVNTNTAEIVAVGNPPLQYSLDMIHWQYSPVFHNLEFKVYNAYVRNASGCVSDSSPFGIFTIFNTITPNGDGINDVWNLKGLELYPGSSVKIFDRYGKLLVNTKIDKKFVWNGKYLGRSLPTASYWYSIELTDGRKLTGWLVIRNHNEKNR